MKLLMLNYEFPPVGRGGANANYFFLQELRNTNYNVDLVTSSPDKFKIEKFSKNITIHKLNIHKKDLHHWKSTEVLKWLFESYVYVPKLMNKKDYDICHCWFGWPAGIVGYLNRNKVPYIVALRGSDVPGHNPRLKPLDNNVLPFLSKIVWSNALAVTVNSKYLQNLARKTLKGNYHLIYNGVDAQKFTPKRHTHGKTVKVISVGGLLERKGYKYLIKAVQGLNCCLTLIGAGKDEKKLRQMAGSNVRFLGRKNTDTVIKELQNSDIFVMPSYSEGMSNSVLEAMACGLPIIVTDASKELVDNNGFVVAKKLSSSIRYAILQYINNKSLIKIHGKQSRKIAEKMTWTRVVEQYKELYNELA